MYLYIGRRRYVPVCTYDTVEIVPYVGSMKTAHLEQSVIFELRTPKESPPSKL